MDLKTVQNIASNAIEYVAAAKNQLQIQSNLIQKQAAAIQELRAVASQTGVKPAQPALDAKQLSKAASAVKACYNAVDEAKLSEIWKSDPNRLLDTISKMASSLQNQLATGNHLGKSASSAAAEAEDAAKTKETAARPAAVRGMNELFQAINNNYPNR